MLVLFQFCSIADRREGIMLYPELGNKMRTAYIRDNETAL
jgi:hypothetical protein